MDVVAINQELGLDASAVEFAIPRGDDQWLAADDGAVLIAAVEALHVVEHEKSDCLVFFDGITYNKRESKQVSDLK